MDPSRIAAVKAWKGHYGKKGALMEELADFVRRAHPATVSSHEIAAHLAAHFHLGFATAEAEFKWRRSRVRNILDRLKKRGLVSPVDVPGASHNDPGRWRWCVEQPADSLESLAALARELGVQVDEAAGEDEGP
jgi:hypothetical protein